MSVEWLQDLWHRTYIPYWWRRWRLGFDPRDLWSIDYAMFKWLLPRLREYRKSPWVSVCTGFTHNGKYWNDTASEADWEGHKAAWDEAIIGEIIWFLEYMEREGNWPFDWSGVESPPEGSTTPEEYRRVMRGYGLLIKWLPSMWE